MAKAEHLLGRQLALVLASLEPSNRLICEVMLHTGLRVSDVLNLRTEQVRNGSRFWIREAKTGKSKLVGIPAGLRADLLAQAGELWLFPGARDPKMHRTRQAVWADIKRAQHAFRIRRNLGSHTMRKDYAEDMLRRFGDVRRVQKALNHSSPSITVLYLMADELTQRRGSARNVYKEH